MRIYLTQVDGLLDGDVERPKPNLSELRLVELVRDNKQHSISEHTLEPRFDIRLIVNYKEEYGTKMDFNHYKGCSVGMSQPIGDSQRGEANLPVCHKWVRWVL